MASDSSKEETQGITIFLCVVIKRVFSLFSVKLRILEQDLCLVKGGYLPWPSQVTPSLRPKIFSLPDQQGECWDAINSSELLHSGDCLAPPSAEPLGPSAVGLLHDYSQLLWDCFKCISLQTAQRLVAVIFKRNSLMSLTIQNATFRPVLVAALKELLPVITLNCPILLTAWCHHSQAVLLTIIIFRRIRIIILTLLLPPVTLGLPNLIFIFPLLIVGSILIMGRVCIQGVDVEQDLPQPGTSCQHCPFSKAGKEDALPLLIVH